MIHPELTKIVNLMRRVAADAPSDVLTYFADRLAAIDTQPKMPKDLLRTAINALNTSTNTLSNDAANWLIANIQEGE